MKAWKKGAIVGGIWGLFTGVGTALGYMCEGCNHGFERNLIEDFLYFPGNIADEVVKQSNWQYEQYYLPIAIITGVLIGVGIGYIIDKSKK